MSMPRSDITVVVEASGGPWHTLPHFMVRVGQRWGETRTGCGLLVSPSVCWMTARRRSLNRPGSGRVTFEGEHVHSACPVAGSDRRPGCRHRGEVDAERV